MLRNASNIFCVQIFVPKNCHLPGPKLQGNTFVSRKMELVDGSTGRWIGIQKSFFWNLESIWTWFWGPAFLDTFFFHDFPQKEYRNMYMIYMYIYIYILYVNKRVTCWSPHSPLILNNNLSPWVSTLSGDGNGSAKETERSLVVWGWRGDYLLPSDIGITIKDYKDPISNVEHSHPWQHNFLPAPASHA